MSTAFLRHIAGIFLLCMFVTGCAPSETPAEEAGSTIQVMLLSGQNNHDWEETNALTQQVLDDYEAFEITVSLTPPQDADEDAWAAWDPDFGAFDVVLMDYNGEMWPDAIMSRFETFIAEGGSALMLHASNNPFPGWTSFEQMVGLLWRSADAGTTVYWNDAGEEIRDEPGVGRGAGHGQKHDWVITNRDPAHPIMNGVPEAFLHPFDELYHGQRGPAENMHVLATAFSSEESGGTGMHEAMIWTIPFGEGTVLTFLPGHHWGDQEDTQAYACVGFRTLLARSLEWLATDAVTIPVPDNFPTVDMISKVDPGT